MTSKQERLAVIVALTLAGWEVDTAVQGATAGTSGGDVAGISGSVPRSTGGYPTGEPIIDRGPPIPTGGTGEVSEPSVDATNRLLRLPRDKSGAFPGPPWGIDPLLPPEPIPLATTGRSLIGE